jgi:hypothetical protein
MPLCAQIFFSSIAKAQKQSQKVYLINVRNYRFTLLLAFELHWFRKFLLNPWRLSLALSRRLCPITLCLPNAPHTAARFPQVTL